MARAFIRVGTLVTYEGAPYVFKRQCSDGVWILEHERTGRLIEKSVDEILDEYSRRKLVFPSKTVNITRKERKSSPKAISELPAKEQEKTKTRLLFARAALAVSASKKAIEAVIEDVWSTLTPRPKSKPGWISVYRWATALRESGEAPACLIADHSSKGNHAPRFPAEVIRTCEETIESTYLTLERATVEHTCSVARAEVRNANSLRPKNAQLKLPSRRLIERLIEQIPAYDRYAARYGRDAARKRFRAVLGYRLTTLPLEYAEIDHTRMDVFAIDDETGVPLGRPWLTVLIDNHTRCILGFHLGFEPPSRATVAKCLRHAFMPKVGLRTQYPDLKNDWVPFGVVRRIGMDNGLEFHSDDLENICFELDIEQHFAPRKTAWFKGKIERFQGTLNREVTATTPGKTFSGIFERDDYDPQKHAVVGISHLRHVITRWIVDVYHQRVHRALDSSPHVMWTSSIRVEDIPLIDCPVQFDAIMGGVDRRKLTHKGIEFNGLFYNSSEMSDLRRLLGDRLDVEIRYDPSNLGSVIVLHPERKTPYRVPCLRPDYAEGLTEWQHKVCKRFARERYQSENDIDAWLESLLEISEMVSKEFNLAKRRVSTRERSARWKQGKSVTSANSQPAKSPQPALGQPAVSVSAAPTQVPPQEYSSQNNLQKVVPKRFAPLLETRASFLMEGRE